MTLPADLMSHPLLGRLMIDTKPLLQEAVRWLGTKAEKHGWVRRKRPPASLRLPDSYYYGVFYHAVRLTEALRRLDDISLYLRYFPGKRTYEKHGITQDKWIRYHYAYYVLTAVSLYDIALLLTNFVFRLGIPESKCRTDVVAQNIWVVGTPVHKALAALDRLVNPYRKERHSHVHRGQLPDPDEIETLDLFSSVQLHAPAVVDAKALNRAYALACTEIVQRMKSKIQQLTDGVRNFFDAILPVYESMAGALVRSVGSPSSSKPTSGKVGQSKRVR